jgi:hypothetical protein
MWDRFTMEYYSALKRKEILTHPMAQLNLGDILLSEIKLDSKVKYCVVPFI